MILKQLEKTINKFWLLKSYNYKEVIDDKMTQKENSIGWYIEQIRQKQASENISDLLAVEKAQKIRAEISYLIEDIK